MTAQSFPTAVPGSPAPNPDKAALAKAGRMVRARLAADPTVQRLPAEAIEIFGVADFLSASECAHLIAVIDKVAKPSGVFDLDYGAQYRTSYSGDVDRADPFMRMIERRIDDLLGLPGEWGETVQGQRYLKGQEFKPHCDWFWTKAPYWSREATRGGQRSWTAMAYLNTVDEGGATEFNRIGLIIPPQPGTLVVWNNAQPDGSINWETMHAGTPVVRGSKYVVTKWYRTRRWG